MRKVTTETDLREYFSQKRKDEARERFWRLVFYTIAVPAFVFAIWLHWTYGG